jgi:hypothetical protein
MRNMPTISQYIVEEVVNVKRVHLKSCKTGL